MQIKNLHNIKNGVIAIAMTLFFSCKNNFNEVQKVGILQNQPIGEAEHINLKYTELKDSIVHLQANLISSKLLDYSNRNFKFSEFPKGIELTLYDENKNKTTIFSDYAIVYDDTDVIDLQGNVIIATHDKDTLFTEQMYYDQNLQWVFTNHPFLFKSLAGNTTGYSFDSDKSLKKLQMLEMDGDFELDN